MKAKFNLLIVLLFLIHFVGAQEWAPLGAKWYYSTPGISSGLLIIESVDDTLINTLNSRILSFDNIREESIGFNEFKWDTTTSFEYFHFGADSISHFDKANSYFYKIYDFNLEAGDTLLVRGEHSPGSFDYRHFEYVVDSIQTKNVGGIDLKFQYTRATLESDWVITSPNNTSYPLIERIGSTLSFLGMPMYYYLADWGAGTLRCYDDGTLFYMHYGYPSNLDCGYLPNSISGISDGEKIAIFPNPAMDYIFVVGASAPNEIQKIEILDQTGQIVRCLNEISQDAVIDIRNLPAGIYIVRYYLKSGFYEILKLVKR